MKKENIIARLFAGLLGIVFCFGLVGFAVLSGLKPLSVSLVKDMVIEELSGAQVNNMLDSTQAVSEENKQLIKETIQDNEELDELIDVYLEGVGNIISTGDMNLGDNTALYDSLNEDFINTATQVTGKEITPEQRQELKQQLITHELKIEQEMNNVAKQAVQEAPQEIQTAMKLYDAVFSKDTLRLYAIVLGVIAFVIILLRIKTSGWLGNIGVAAIFAAIFIALVPIIFTVAESAVLEGKFVIPHKDYYYKFALYTALIGIVMCVIKSVIFKKRKLAMAVNNDECYYE